MKLCALLLAFAALASAAKQPQQQQQQQQQQQHKKNRPLITAHRGASGYLPESTLEAFTLAIEMGADFIEPDLVSTKDGHLIVRHEPNIGKTTNVANHTEFASRKRNNTVDGVTEEGFWASDFTLAEIKTLGAVQAFPERDHSHDGQFKVATFEEVIALAKSKAKQVNRTIGIYPETKHPTYHRKLGLPIEEKMLKALDKAGWNHADAPVLIQSFEVGNLKALRKKTKIKLVQLYDGDVDLHTGDPVFEFPYARPYDWTVAGDNRTYGHMLTAEGLDEIKTYADIISPYKRFIVTTLAKYDANGKVVDVNGDGKIDERDYTTQERPEIIKMAHARGLKVHAYTFRNEDFRLAGDYKNDPKAEYIQFWKLGLDGMFSDFTKTAVEAREIYMKQN